MSISFALGISHTPWVPARVKTMARLADALNFYHVGHEDDRGVNAAKLFDEKAPLHVWSLQMWKWASRQDATHCIFLQDDLIVPDNFWSAASAICEAYPAEIIGLETIHPYAKTVARNGGHMCTTADGLVGCGYILPNAMMPEFLDWRAHRLNPMAFEPGGLTEDCLINVFALDTGRRIFHPCPTIIRPDLTIASTYGNDHHPYREPSVTWEDGPILRKLDGEGHGWDMMDLERPEFWKGEGDPPHFGHFYSQTHWYARQYCRSWNESKTILAERDKGPQSARKWIQL